MSKAPPTAHRCSFCARDVSEVELLFRSEIGGVPPNICGDCITHMAEVVAENAVSPRRAALLVEANNAVAEQQAKERKDAA